MATAKDARPKILTRMHFTLRGATVSDAVAIADVYSASFRLPTFLPMLHTIEENRRFIGKVILKECEVTVAKDKTGTLAFLALRVEEVRLLVKPIPLKKCCRSRSLLFEYKNTEVVLVVFFQVKLFTKMYTCVTLADLRNNPIYAV